MRLRAVLVGAVLSLSAAPAWAQSATATAKVDPSLEETKKRFTQAFNSFDPQAVASFFAADATLINPMGKVGHGPAEIAKVFEEDASRFFKGSTSTFTITGTRNVTPDTVWLDVDHTAQNARRPDGTTGSLSNHVVMLAQKQGNEWKWLEVRPYSFIPADHAHTGSKGSPHPGGKATPHPGGKASPHPGGKAPPAG